MGGQTLILPTVWLSSLQKPDRLDLPSNLSHRPKRSSQCGRTQAYVQLIVNIGSVLQKSVHHLSVAVLGGGGERRATVLPQTHTQKRQKKKKKKGSSQLFNRRQQHRVAVLSQNDRIRITKSVFCKQLCWSLYLCPELSGGTEFKEELHNLIMTLLGGKKQGGGACLEGTIKINAAVFTSKAVLSFSLCAKTNATTGRDFAVIFKYIYFFGLIGLF